MLCLGPLIHPFGSDTPPLAALMGDNNSIPRGLPRGIELFYVYDLKSRCCTTEWILAVEEVNSSNFQFVEELTELRRSLVRCADDPALLGLDSIVKTVPDLIYRLDADGRILFIN